MRTESWRSGPPATIFTGIRSSAASTSRRARASIPAGTAITASPTEVRARIVRSDAPSRVERPNPTNALGVPTPSRSPLPAATTIADARIYRNDGTIEVERKRTSRDLCHGPSSLRGLLRTISVCENRL